MSLCNTKLVGLSLLLTVLACGPARAETEAPDELVRQTADSVLALIDESRDYVDENPERFYREVEALLSPAVDFEGFARSVMATHYRDASPEQRERFAESFKWGLVRTYALALTEFNDGEVVVLPPDRPSRNPKRETVKMEVRTANGEVWPVLYSMALDKDGQWKVRNLIVNGINMGLTYRNQFNGAIRDPKYGNDLDKVIDDWGDLIEEADDEVTGPAESAAIAGPSAGQAA